MWNTSDSFSSGAVTKKFLTCAKFLHDPGGKMSLNFIWIWMRFQGDGKVIQRNSGKKKNNLIQNNLWKNVKISLNYYKFPVH